MAPTDVPQRMLKTACGNRFSPRTSRRPATTPTWYAPRAPPPESTMPVREPGGAGSDLRLWGVTWSPGVSRYTGPMAQQSAGRDVTTVLVHRFGRDFRRRVEPAVHRTVLEATRLI